MDFKVSNSFRAAKLESEGFALLVNDYLHLHLICEEYKAALHEGAFFITVINGLSMATKHSYLCAILAIGSSPRVKQFAWKVIRLVLLANRYLRHYDDPSLDETIMNYRPIRQGFGIAWKHRNFPGIWQVGISLLGCSWARVKDNQVYESNDKGGNTRKVKQAFPINWVGIGTLVIKDVGGTSWSWVCWNRLPATGIPVRWDHNNSPKINHK